MVAEVLDADADASVLPAPLTLPLLNGGGLANRLELGTEEQGDALEDVRVGEDAMHPDGVVAHGSVPLSIVVLSPCGDAQGRIKDMRRPKVVVTAVLVRNLGESTLLLQESLVVEDREVVEGVALPLVPELTPEGVAVALTPRLDVLEKKVGVGLHESSLSVLTLLLQRRLQGALGCVVAEEGCAIDLVHESRLHRRELLGTEVGGHLVENFLTGRRRRARKGTELGGRWDFNFSSSAFVAEPKKRFLRDLVTLTLPVGIEPTTTW